METIGSHCGCSCASSSLLFLSVRLHSFFFFFTWETLAYVLETSWNVQVSDEMLKSTCSQPCPDATSFGEAHVRDFSSFYEFSSKTFQWWAEGEGKHGMRARRGQKETVIQLVLTPCFPSWSKEGKKKNPSWFESVGSSGNSVWLDFCLLIRVFFSCLFLFCTFYIKFWPGLLLWEVDLLLWRKRERARAHLSLPFPHLVALSQCSCSCG